MIYVGFFYLLTLQLIIMSKDIFGRERELCLLFIKNKKSNGLSFDFSISNSSVDLIVRYSNPDEWDQEKGRKNIDRLWKNFNLAFIGYNSHCNVVTYRTNMQFVTEYSFTMLKFNYENFHSAEFAKYNNTY